jgi:hypothetical protein
MGLFILGDVTEVADLGLQTPVPLVLGEQGVLVEEAICQVSQGMPSTRCRAAWSSTDPE